MVLQKKCFLASFFIYCLLFSNAFGEEEKIVFKKSQIEIGQKLLTIELAESPAEHERGLMFRKKLDPGYGMLFVFEDEEIRSFWMKNTFIDLSIGYFDKSKALIDIQDMKATGSIMDNRPQTYVSKGPAKYALEVPVGWFLKNKIRLGQKFRFKPLSK